MTPKWLLGLALLLYGIYAVLTSEAAPMPPSNPECEEAVALFQQGLYDQALAEYDALLGQDSPPECARAGLAAVGTIRCAMADRLMELGLEDAASAVYTELVLADPGRGCPQGVEDPAPPPSQADVQSDAEATAGIRAWFVKALGWATTRISAVELVALLALAIVLVVHLSRLRAQRRKPSVEVSEFENATGDDTLDKRKGSVAALLRARLWDSGVSPPAMPGAIGQQSAFTVLEASPHPQGKFVAALSGFLLDLASPKSGYKVTGTLQQRGDGKAGIQLLLTNAYSGRAQAVRVVWGMDQEQAAEMAAAVVYQQVATTRPKEETSQAGMRWTGTGDSMRWFFQGRDEERAGNTEAALRLYTDAAAAEPANVLPRFHQAGILSEQKDFIAALRIYLDTVLFWPELRRARYRLAATYTFADAWRLQWDDLSSDQKDRLLTKVALAEGKPNISRPTDARWETWFLERAKYQWKKTLELSERETRSKRRQRGWLLRRADRILARWPGTRWENLRLLLEDEITTKTALVCTDLQLDSGRRENLERELCHLVKKRSATWQAHYNAACFYSLALGHGGSDNEQGRRLADEALRHLGHALNDPGSEVSAAWLCADPDLEALRCDERGALLRSTCKMEDSSLGERRREVVRRLRLAWELVAKGADRRQSEWAVRKTSVETWTGVQGKDLKEWSQGEADAWSRLSHLARRPEDMDRQAEFWKSLLKPAEEAKLPDLTLPEEEKLATEAQYREAWEHLAECAGHQQELWDRLEDRVRGDVMDGTHSFGQGHVADMAETAREAWLALKDWAEAPLDAGSRVDFRKKAGCEPSLGDRLARLLESLRG
jgi:tetratricopeptide (TPR) repeat protein